MTDIYPGHHSATRFTAGELIYEDSPHYALATYPESLEGQVMLRGVQERSEQMRLARVFRVTRFPATATPDQIALTWSENPQTTQTVQWRTSTDVSETASNSAVPRVLAQPSGRRSGPTGCRYGTSSSSTIRSATATVP